MKDHDALQFCGVNHAQNPDHVIIAMLAVSRYLKWHNGPFKNAVLMDLWGTKTATTKEQGEAYHHVWLGDVQVDEAIWMDGKKPYIAKVTSSYSWLYVNHKKVMHICGTGNTDWCRVTRKQLIGAINDWYYNQNRLLIPEYGFSILPMFSVEKTEPYVAFSEEDFRAADETFIKFINTNCKKPGSYSFKNEDFRKGTGLPTAGLVWHYLTNRHDYTDFNGMNINSAYQDKDTDTIEFTLY